MAKSLLAYLYPRIKGSQEDVATISLQYLISQSEELNEAFTDFIARCINSTLPKLQYFCQETGEEGERPDMVGKDSSGHDVVLCEMKFYAGLTSNQPNTYLNRLRKSGGKGLVFITPKARRTVLWSKLKTLSGAEETEGIEYSALIDGVRMAIVTWDEVLDCIDRAERTGKYKADIQQLKGYCEQMDIDAFVPFGDGDFSAEVARKEERYYQVIDETANLLCADKNISAVKTRINPNRNYYEQRLEIDNFKVWLIYDRNLWKSDASEETPFWVSVLDKNANEPEKFLRVLETIPASLKDHYYSITYLALIPQAQVSLDEICKDLKQQVLAYIDKFRTAQ